MTGIIPFIENAFIVINAGGGFLTYPFVVNACILGIHMDQRSSPYMKNPEIPNR